MVATGGGNADDSRASASLGAVDVTAQTNKNLSGDQKESLKSHFKLGHAGFKHIRWLSTLGKISILNAKAVANCDVVKCATCKFGEACKQPMKA